jgi:hypothetical protein
MTKKQKGKALLVLMILGLSPASIALLCCNLAGGRLGAPGRKLQQPNIRNLTVNAPLAERGGRCGPMYAGFHCNEQCCSGNFWCGNEAEHCVRGGCLKEWGVCGQSKA